MLTVNPYYRTVRAPVLPEGASFRDEATRKKIFPLMRSLSPETNVTDAKAFVDYLDAQDAVASDRKMGDNGGIAWAAPSPCEPRRRSPTGSVPAHRSTAGGS